MDSTIGARYRVLVKRKRGARYASFSTVFYFRTSIGLKWKTGVLYQKSKKSKKIFYIHSQRIPHRLRDGG